MTDTAPFSPVSNEEALQQLQDLVADNPDLRRLEDLMEPLNTVEAAGMTQQEIRHYRHRRDRGPVAGVHGFDQR